MSWDQSGQRAASDQTIYRMPVALEIEVESSDGSGMLRALAYRHGEPIAAAARSLDRLFLLRAPWAPGLRFAGGIARTPIPEQGGLHTAGIKQTGQAPATMSVAGSGLSIEDALASCVGEAVERLSQVRRPKDVSIAGTLRDVDGHLLQGVRERAKILCEAIRAERSARFDWIEARCGSISQECLVPADWCLRSPGDQLLRVPGAALSTGVAAGATVESATLGAILELIERDAVSLWWIGGRRARTPTVDAGSMGEAHSLLATLRQGNQDRVTWILDLTTDLHVPVMAAVSSRPDGYGFVCGFGARLNARDAVRAAILEMCQMELGLNIAEAKDSPQSCIALPDADRVKLALARGLDTHTCELLQPGRTVADVEAVGSQHEGAALPALMQHLARLGIEVALVNLSRPEFGIPVVAAIAPDLQLMPSQLVTRRLRNAIAESGGGARFTKGLSLF